MVHRWSTLFAFVLLLASTVTCATTVPYHLVGQLKVYTLTNLHPDEASRRLYTVNYQQAGLIPRCTEVKIHEVASQGMRFTVVGTGRTYDYVVHGSLQESFTSHLDRYFGQQCEPGAIEGMSVIDKRGIEHGKAYTGMTRNGVILALGYPPFHATPSLESPQWRYWKNRFDTFVLHFENETVAIIED